MKKFILNIWYTLLYQFDQHKNEIPQWWYEQKPFDQRPQWLQRITIAEDVIAQLRIHKYRAETGNYISHVLIDDDDERSWNIDVKSNFHKIQSCTVCAMGACLLSITKFKNKATFEDLRDGDGKNFRRNQTMQNLLVSTFTPVQLSLIEWAFESRDYIMTVGQDVHNAYVPYEDKQTAVNFGSKYRDSSERLIAIMENIIDNKGEFKP